MNNEHFKSEDYIYLRITKDFKAPVNKWDEKYYEEGQIIRLKKEWLIYSITSKQLSRIFNGYGIINAKEESNYILDNMNSIYNSVLRNPKTRELFNDIENEINLNNIEPLNFSEFLVREGYYCNEFLLMFDNSELITDEEKEFLFNEDFSNAIYARDEIRSSIISSDEDDSMDDEYDSIYNFYNLEEYHYFILNEDIKVKDKYELYNQFKDIYGISLNSGVEMFDYKDVEGNLKVIYLCDSHFDNSNREHEQKILNIARRATVEEAIYYHKKRVAAYIEFDQERDRIQKERWAREAKELEEAYDNNKNSSTLFPGVNGEFVHIFDEEVQKTHKNKYSLQQIKEFFQLLKKLNSDITKEMCFYGGTIPYILTDAEESREFGDIDIFVPVPVMEALRTELSHQKSFEMVFDSKPLAQACHFTSRVQKESGSFKVPEETEKENQNLLRRLERLMNPEDDYDQKTQDFGFKAKLFGVNISVFPMYQYGSDIMAKSFNVNEQNEFLLGVRVLNETLINDLVKKIQIYGSEYKMLPLEYTLVSKENAINANYENRLPNDIADIKYILNHKEELSISDEMIEQIKANYPEYSVSVAYLLLNNRTLKMSGERYKELVLTNKNSRSFT